MSLVYLIKWEKCLDSLLNAYNMHILNIGSDGILISTDNDRDLVIKAIDEGCTAYARYYRFRMIKRGKIDNVLDVIKPFDLWIENDLLNVVVNPLRLSTLDIARILYKLDFELELVNEEDVEFTK
ncbi:hypothetical protein [Vulcanisaeta souniana]|uniref:Uncharacterized protein n=1 Tax=Vulcanisaeta souniana JCM 11219 TaxID=1293586 RepID=A0A830EAT1_9CREN|nr:hypothetical protein [Vulcanisaeta souniana]BDR91157.1 hypothetical protein Vsou_02500 [Vulcanisaeta souniana JCM 11219]GGI81280.1 hypothetical protein GCM10007112_17540 [Vulcanisaeta souniana JCM 11219]